MDTAGPRNRARVTRESWWTPCSLGEECESPGRAGRPRGLTETGASRPRQLFDTAGTGTRPKVGRDIWSTPQDLRLGPESPGRASRQCGPSTGARVARECCRTPRALGEDCESLRRAGRPRGLSEPCAILPGELVDPAGPRNRAREDWDSWSTPWTIRPGPESHGTDVRPRGSLDTSPRRPGFYSTSLAHVPKPE